jgi:hypothetical protein
MTRLENLQTVSKALYLKERSAIQSILSQEAALRAQLAMLDTQVKQAASTGAELSAMRSIGADVVWMAWVDRTRTQLNSQLAQVLARKLQKMDKVRRAFGKTIVADKLVENEQSCLKHKRAEKALAAAIGNSQTGP